MTRRTRSIQISDVIRAAIKLPSGLDVTDQANTARNQANSAFDHANTAYSHAGDAFNHANNAHNQANSAYAAANTKLNSSGGTISGNLIVTGNLFVEGDSTSFNVASLLIEDSEIYLNNNQTTPSLNASIFAERGSSTDTFIRWNESTDKWGWSDDGSAFYSFDDVRSGLATTNTTFGTINTNIGTAYSQANAAYSQANAAYGQANSAFTAANNRVLKSGDTMTGSLTLGAGRTVGAGGIVLSHTGLNTDVLANGRAAGVSTGWGTFRIHQEAGNPGLIIAGDANQTAPFLRIQNSSETARLVFDAGGNLLIGTTSTGYGKLGVESGNTFFGVAPSTYTSAIFGPRPATDGFCSVVLQYNTSGNYWKFDSSSSAFTFYENGTLRSYFTNSGQLVLSATTGTAPLVISSTTAVANLNADLWDGYQFADYLNQAVKTTSTPTFTGLTVSNTIAGSINGTAAVASSITGGMPNNTDYYMNFRVMRNSNSSVNADGMYIGYSNTGSGPTRIYGGGSASNPTVQYADYLERASGSIRAPLFYDYDDTSYYLNPAATSKTYDMWAANRLYTGSNQNYININADQIWRPDNGTLHLQYSGSGAINMCNGGGTVTSVGNFYAPIMYDNNDASYYVNPNGGSRLWTMTPYVLYFGGVGGDSTIGNQGYAIYQEGGAWTHPYPDLAIAYHTGIKIGAYYGYNGTRFYNNNDMGTQIASVGDGDNNFRSYYNVIAYASDRRLKENIQPIENAIEKVKKITGMTFDWKPMVKDLGFEPNSIHETGVIAQDVEAVLPEAVEIAPFDYDWKQPNKSKSGEKYLTVKYEKLVPLLIQAIKEQQEQIEELKNLIKEKL